MNTYGARPLQVLQRASGASEHAGGAVPSDGGKRARKRLGGLGSMRTGVTAPRDELTRVRQLSELGFTYQQRKKPVTSFRSTLGVTPLHESRGKTEELLPSPAAREGWRRCRERWAHRKKNARSGNHEIWISAEIRAGPSACWAGPAFRPDLEKPRQSSLNCSRGSILVIFRLIF